MQKFKSKLHEIIFEADTLGGKAFDIALLVGILMSILVVMLESVADLKLEHGKLLNLAEWIFTIIFTLEYFLRIWIIGKSQ